MLTATDAALERAAEVCEKLGTATNGNMLTKIKRLLGIKPSADKQAEPSLKFDREMERMLTPRELYRAQGFPDSYIIDHGADGRALTKTAQVRMCGNSVSPYCSRAIVGANYRATELMREAA